MARPKRGSLFSFIIRKEVSLIYSSLPCSKYGGAASITLYSMMRSLSYRVSVCPLRGICLGSRVVVIAECSIAALCMMLLF